VLYHQSFIPTYADGWSRTTTPEGTRVTAWGAHPCSASACFHARRGLDTAPCLGGATRRESGPPAAARTFRLRRNGVADRTRTDTAGLTTPGACRYTTATMETTDPGAAFGGTTSRLASTTQLGLAHGLGRGLRRFRPEDENGDDRDRTGDRSPDKRVLLPSELRPQVARAGFEPAISSS
jgi:hypothetical protein